MRNLVIRTESRNDSGNVGWWTGEDGVEEAWWWDRDCPYCGREEAKRLSKDEADCVIAKYYDNNYVDYPEEVEE